MDKLRDNIKRIIELDEAFFKKEKYKGGRTKDEIKGYECLFKFQLQRLKSLLVLTQEPKENTKTKFEKIIGFIISWAINICILIFLSVITCFFLLNFIAAMPFVVENYPDYVTLYSIFILLFTLGGCYLAADTIFIKKDKEKKQ